MDLIEERSPQEKLIIAKTLIEGALQELPCPKPETAQNVSNDDSISRKMAIDALHKTMIKFFQTNDDDEPEFITASERMLLSVNKAISNALKELPSAQSELEDKIRAIGYTGKEGRIYIGGRLFAVRELPQ